MKVTRAFVNFLLVVLAGVGTADAGQYWFSGDGVNLGGSGGWNTISNNWRSGSPAGGFTNWPNVDGSGDEAVFTNTGGAVALSGTINASKFTFQVNAWTLTNGTLNLGGGAASISLTNSARCNVYSELSGSGTLTLNSYGNLFGEGLGLYGNNTGFTGKVVAQRVAGTYFYVAVSNDSGFGAVPSVPTADALTFSNMNVRGVGSSPITIPTNRGITAPGGVGFYLGSFIINAPITGTGSIGLRNTTVTLNNPSNTISGGGTTGIASLNGGTLIIGADNALAHGGSNQHIYFNDFDGTSKVDLNGHLLTINGFGGNKTVAASAIDNSATGTATLVVGDANLTSSFTGVVKNTGAALSLTKIGTGTLTLGGSNSFSGTTLLSNGALSVGHAHALAGEGTITFGGGTLRYSAINQQDYGARIKNSNGAISLDSNGQDITFAGAMDDSNTNGLNKSGGGTLTLSGTNAYMGTSIVSNGALQLGDSGVLAAGWPFAINGTGATFAVNGQTQTIGRLTGTGGRLDLGANGMLTVNYSNTASTLASAMTGTGTLAIVGTGGLYGSAYDLTGNNSNFTGRISMTYGSLRANSDTTLGAVPESFVADALSLSNSKLSTVNFSNLTISANRGISVGGSVIFAGGLNLIVNSVISGTGAAVIRSSSAYAVTFAGTNTYSGLTQIYTDDANSSTLRLGANDALPFGAGKGNLDIRAWNTGIAKFDLNGFSQTVNGLTSAGTTSSTNAILDNLGGADSTLTVGDNNAAGSFGGIIRNSAAYELGLTKIGTGTQTLSGANTYLGATTVSNGTLALAGSGTLGGSNIVIAAGATLRVTGRTNGSLVLAAAQSLSGGGVFAGTLNNDGSVAPGSASPGTLTVNGDFAQTNGTLDIRIASGANGLLSVANSAALGGTLTVTLESYTPATNDVFLILTANAITGDFAATNLPSLAAGEGWLLQNLGGQALLLSVTGAPPPSATGYDLYAQAITNGQTAYNEFATGDGYPNLLKYVTGSSPTQSDTLARMDSARTNGVLSLLFNHDTNTTDATLIVEGAYSTTNDATWNGIATNIAGSWGGATNVVENTTTNPASVTVSDIVGPTTNRFLRLRVTRP